MVVVWGGSAHSFSPYLVVAGKHSFELKVLAEIHVIPGEGSLEGQPPPFLLASVLFVRLLLHPVVVGHHGETLEEALDLVGVRDDLAFAQLLEREDGFRCADEYMEKSSKTTFYF